MQLIKKAERKKKPSENRCSRFGLSAHNLTNRRHIQLHSSEEICYLSCSSKWFIFLFAVRIFFPPLRLIRLLFRILFCAQTLLNSRPLLCVCALFHDHFRSTFSSSFGVLMIMLQKPVYFGEHFSMLCLFNSVS